MPKQTILEYLIDKGELDRIAINKTSYQRIIEAGKQVKKTIKANRIRRYNKAYYHKNKERCNANWKKYYEANKDKIYKQQKKYRKSSKRYKAGQARYCASDAGKAAKKRWRDKNKDRLNAERRLKRTINYLIKTFYIYGLH